MTVRTEGSERIRWRLAIASWVGFFLFYEILAGGPSGPELAAGGLSAFLATVAVFASGDREHLGRMRWGWWRILLCRLPREILADTVRIVRAAFGPSAVSGRFRTVFFEPGGDDPVSGSRRALVTAGGSIAPNSFIARIEAEDARILVHQLIPTDPPPADGDPLWTI